MTDILVFIPGILGSELHLDGKKIWPGSLGDALGKFSDKEFDRLLSEQLVAKDIVRRAIGGFVNVYDRWMKAFENISPAVGAPPKFQENANPQTLYAFPYDWRRNILDSAGSLAAFLAKILANAPEAKLHLVAHSMGGLVARAFLENPVHQQSVSWKKVATLTTFGTPHLGAPIAFAGVSGLQSTQFLTAQQSQRLANDPRYPSLYQLCPDPHQAFLLQTTFLKPLDWTSLDGLTQSGIDAWRQLRSVLGNDRPAHVAYFQIVGSRVRTLTGFENQTPGPPTPGALARKERESGGDGTVPLAGALLPGVRSDLVAMSHANLINTRQAREVLAAIFGGVTLAAAAGETEYQIGSVEPQVFSDQSFQAFVHFDPPQPDFQGFIRFENALNFDEATSAEALVFGFPLPNLPLRLEGPDFDQVTINLSIEFEGLWRLALLSKDEEPLAFSDPFVVSPRQTDEL